MIFHLSMASAQPEWVAGALAELWRGKLLPLPPIGTGSLVVMAGDERNSPIAPPA